MYNIPQTFLLIASSIIFSATCLDAEVVKILIQGDSQKIMDPGNGKQDNFIPLMAKLLTDPLTRDADFILQMGDIVESDLDDSDRSQQYAVAREGWKQLDGKIPYVLNLGNNDNDDEYFAAFGDLPEPVDKDSDNRNFAYFFQAGGVDWLVISMRFWPQSELHALRKAEFDWAKGLIEGNPEAKVIFIKHEVNVKSWVVNQLKIYPNVVLILSGHTNSEYQMLTGNNGNKIGWIRTCHHNANLDSYFRMLLIDTVQGTVSSSFYSPQYEKFFHDPTAPYHRCIDNAPWKHTGFDFGVANTAESEALSNDAKFISLEVPCCVIAGSEFDVNIKVLNTGTAEWNAVRKKKKYKLGSLNPKGNSDWGHTKNRTVISENVPPGSAYTFEINCTSPDKTGYYNFQRQMIKDRKGGFGDYSENRVIYVAFNEMENGSFEDDGTLDTVWKIGDGASWNDLEQKSGISSLRLSGPSTATTQKLQLKKYTNYKLDFWAKRINRDDLTAEDIQKDNVILNIHDPSSKKSVLDLMIVHGMKDGEWARFSGDFNSGSSGSLNLRLYGNNLKSTVYFDDLIIKQANPYSTDFVSGSTLIAYRDIEFSHKIDVTDFDNHSLTYRLVSKPEWLDFDEKTATLSGMPRDEDLGIHALTLHAIDNQREEIFTFVIKVLETSPLDNWNELHGIYGETSDGDGDGLVNLLEFALGGDPNKSDVSDKLPKLVRSSSGFDFEFRRNQLTLTYTIKESTDLINWSFYAVVDDLRGFVGDTCTVNVPALDEKKFFKLEVNQ